MKIDPNELICGVRPALLKQLLKSEEFTTPDAMLVLGLSEPFASQTLLALHEKGWIRYVETSDFIDYWKRASKGTRLVATKLIKRFPVAEGRAILPKIVELAREINADPDIFTRITEIRLFGSVLTAGDNETAGDIDLVVCTRWREVSSEEKKRLFKLVQDAMPLSASFSDTDDWATRLVLRRVKKLSPRISLHFEGDLALEGVCFTSLYSYDAKLEKELVPDTSVRSLAFDPAVRDDDAANVGVPGEYRFSPPALPERHEYLTFNSNTNLRYAQHMWVRGASAAEIAGLIPIDPRVVEAYLATALVAPRLTVNLEPSIKNTIRRLLPATRDFDVQAKICVDPAGRFERGEIDFMKGHERVASAVCDRLRMQVISISGRCDLLPLVEIIATAERLWITKMKPNCKGIALSTEIVVKADDDLTPSIGGRWLDYRPLANAMRTVLLGHLPVPRTRRNVGYHYLDVEFGSELAVIHEHRLPYNHTKTDLTPVPEAKSCRLIAKELNRKIALDEGDTMLATLCGLDLAESSDKLEEVF